MYYQIEGRLIRHDLLNLSHEDFISLIRDKFTVAIRMLCESSEACEVLAGGMPVASRNLVMTLNFPKIDSHGTVREFLSTLPIFEYYEWRCIPLETFPELLSNFGQ